MPPKKKPEKKNDQEGEPLDYNVNVMTLDQLKKYARLLESEIEDMRKHCNFYQKVEDELCELLRCAEEDLKHNEEILLFKDIELEKLKLKSQKHLLQKRQLPKYMKHNSSEKKEKLSSDISARLEEEDNRHILETKKLKSILEEKDRQLEALRVKIEMGRRETKNNNQMMLTNVDSCQKNFLEQVISKYEKVNKETEEQFKLARKLINLEAREGKIRSERSFNENCIAFKQKLSNYYKEVTKQDLDTIKKLKNKIVKMEESIKCSKALLEKSVEENERCKKMSKLKFKNVLTNERLQKFTVSPEKMNEGLKTHSMTEKLTLENDDLEKQIKDVVERTYKLRKQFTVALEKVRKSAEMKVEFLDKKLNFILDEKQNKTARGVSFSNLSTEELNLEQSMPESEMYSDTSDIA